MTFPPPPDEEPEEAIDPFETGLQPVAGFDPGQMYQVRFQGRLVGWCWKPMHDLAKDLYVWPTVGWVH